MKNKITKLIDVKTIVTLVLIVVMAALTLKGQAIDEKFYNLVLMVVTYFFARKSGKDEA